MAEFPDFQGLVTLTLDRVILHTIMRHSSTTTYISKNELFSRKITPDHFRFLANLCFSRFFRNVEELSSSLQVGWAQCWTRTLQWRVHFTDRNLFFVSSGHAVYTHPGNYVNFKSESRSILAFKSTIVTTTNTFSLSSNCPIAELRRVLQGPLTEPLEIAETHLFYTPDDLPVAHPTVS